MKRREKQEDLLNIIYYTDPLCCWSWAFEPQWRRLLYEMQGKIDYRYVMGGLLPSWKHFNDSINSVTRPVQMGPVWMHAKELSGMPIEQNIWMRDPPASSYPACVAVKAAAIQSREAEENLLRLLREEVMLSGKNIAKKEIIYEAVERLGEIDENFDPQKFQKDFVGNDALELFRKDLAEVEMKHIARFPSLVIKNNNKAILISGCHPYAYVIQQLQNLTGIEVDHEKIDADSYKNFWPSVTKREMDEIWND
ncbi:MAG: DsbA family oxidoreductase [Ginsengibacter sp.]